MKTNDLGHRSCRVIAEVAIHGIPDHGAQLLQSLSLCYYGVPERRSHEAAIRRVFLDFENDLTHVALIAPPGRRVNVACINAAPVRGETGGRQLSKGTKIGEALDLNLALDCRSRTAAIPSTR